jgi:hypothetical protein
MISMSFIEFDPSDRFANYARAMIDRLATRNQTFTSRLSLPVNSLVSDSRSACRISISTPHAKELTTSA